MRKIDDKILLEMIDGGAMQTECAERFAVTPAAVCRRLKRLRPPPLPEAVTKLTDKQAKFAVLVASGETLTQAAFDSYECGDRLAAKSIGAKLNQNPEVREAIDVLLKETGLTRRHLFTRLRQHTDHDDPAVSLRAVDMGLRLTDSYPATKSVNLNLNADVCPVDLERYR